MDHQPEIVTDNDKLIAMFSHLSMFFGSLLVPGLFWYIYKEKSKFITFHSLQAFFFHLVYAFVMIAVVFITAIAGGLAGFFEESSSRSADMGFFKTIYIIAFCFIFLGLFAYSYGYAIYLAIKTYRGEFKKYPVIGNMIYNKVYGIN